ncbi:TolC family protein [Chengkuizengella axinellae]|uniref:TolC family protein n=1 Tax=Chengkuizengella axinellae TaxID=3064388 RepID=A0ABT9IYR0_9BACL|nr:TolC family protein [Chengkuizengella sp. 2205SS18-9]MDP5274511.1 TolC family protein [Chengkuizengella sp. 2205SS18-9]
MKKRILVACLALAIPTMTVLAAERVKLSVNEAVDEILLKDTSLEKFELDEFKLTSAANAFMGTFSEELEELQDVQQEYTEQATQWGVEFKAYSLLYNYLKLEEAVKLQEENLEVTKGDASIVGIKYDEGLASKQDFIQAEMSVSNAKLSLETAKQSLKSLEYELNQMLDLDLLTSLEIEDIGDIKRLKSSEYKAEKVADEMKLGHESLTFYRFVMETYEEIIEESEDLKGYGSYAGQISGIEAQIKVVEAEIEELKNVPEPDETEIAKKEAEKLYYIETLNDLETQANKDKRKAEDDIQDYYGQEKEKAQMDLFDQMDLLELNAYRFADEFEVSHMKLNTLEDNIKTQEELYKMMQVRFDEGFITATDLEKSRVGVLNAKMDLLNAEIDYALLKVEYELFKEGFLPR